MQIAIIMGLRRMGGLRMGLQIHFKVRLLWQATLVAPCDDRWIFDQRNRFRLGPFHETVIIYKKRATTVTGTLGY